MRKTDLNRFNTGGSHNQNPNGGIPQGVGNNGQMNTVEEGETSIDNFVFSDKIKLNKSIIKEFNLPNNLEGKTIAQATKIIDNKFKDRNDKISTSTKTKMLDGIAQAQESIKAKRETLSQSLEANSMEVPDMMEGLAPTGMEEFLPQNQMFLGGMTDNLLAPGINQGLSGVSNLAMGNKNEALNNGVSLATSVAGTAIGGPIGGAIGSFVGDLAGGLLNRGRMKRQRDEMIKRNHIVGSGTYQNDFALGGSTRPRVNSVLPLEETNELNLNNNLASQYYFDNMSTPVGNAIQSLPQADLSGSNLPPKANLKPVANWLGNNYGDILRYAPVAANALQLSQLEKAKPVTLNRLNNRFTPDYVDERNVQNIISNETDNTLNALTNASNGSIGSLRNSILGASLNRTKGLSDAYLNLSAQNRNQNMIGQQFNASIDQTNMGQANMEQDINDRNSAAYETNKSRLISAVGENLGDIGKEEVYKKLARQTYGYTWDGRYWNKPDGSKATDEEVKQEIQSNTNQSKLGGMLFKNKKY